MLKRLQLWEKRDTQYAKLSGGQKQRLALALALLNDPQVLFLDEPSAGLDPQARLEIHELVLDLRREQRTILLTTHYIEEAEKLCDRVAIVDEGRIVAIGTPRQIQEKVLAQATIEIELATPLDGVARPQWLESDELHGGRCAPRDLGDHDASRAQRGGHGEVAGRAGHGAVRYSD